MAWYISLAKIFQIYIIIIWVTLYNIYSYYRWCVSQRQQEEGIKTKFKTGRNEQQHSSSK